MYTMSFFRFRGLIINVRMFLTVLCLSSCHSTSTINDATKISKWDFDHQVHYRERLLKENQYHLEIIPKNESDFSSLSTFLVRYSFMRCKHYGYTIKILSGVEGFDDRRLYPNVIRGSLIAKIDCSYESKN